MAVNRARLLDPAEVLRALERDRLMAITLWPEWAWAIDLPSTLAKRVENRDWAPPGRYLAPHRALLAIHAGAHIGGRKGLPARREGLLSVAMMARCAGLIASTPARGKAQFIPGLHGQARDLDLELYDVLDHGTVSTARRPVVTSAIIGIARLTHVIPPGEEERNRDLRETGGVYGWKVPDLHGWVFDYCPLTEPVPHARGEQGLWRVSDDQVRRIAARVAA